MSALTKFGIGTTSTVDTALQILSCGIVSKRGILNANGMNGTRSRIAERSIFGPEDVRGPVRASPSFEESLHWLTWSGLVFTGTSGVLAETLVSRYASCDRVEKVPVWSDCYVDALTISASKGVPWEFALDIIGQQETEGNAASFPAISVTETAPSALHDCVFTFLSGARSVSSFSMTLRNFLDADSFNSDYNIAIHPQDREVSLSLLLPYNGNTDLLRAPLPGSGGTAVFTRANYSLTLTFGKVQFERGDVVINGKGRPMIQLNGMAMKTGSTMELAVTLDSTS